METTDSKPTDAAGKRRVKLEQQLRQLETDAYCAVISAFRAQGDLTWKKAQLLQELRQALRVPEERHKMELKRVTDDDSLCEISKLSSSLNFAESELDAAAVEDAAKPRSRKKAKHGWGDNKEKTLPYLDAVPAAVSSQPPNLSKIPPAAKEGKSKSKPKAATSKVSATPTKATASSSHLQANRKRKASPSTKKSGGSSKKRAPSKSKAEVKAEEVPDMVLEDHTEKAGAEPGDDEDEAQLKEMEEQLRAKQEQLRAELAALQAEIADDEEEEEGAENEGAQEGENAAEDSDEGGDAEGEGAEVVMAE